MCAKGFSEGIENSFALRRKATKDEDGFLAYSINDLTNFLIVQE